MDSVKLLIQGYAKQLPDGRWDATSATVLVKSGGKKVIIDPGEFPEALQAALEKEGLQIKDIDWVVCSHSSNSITGFQSGLPTLPSLLIFVQYYFPNQSVPLGDCFAKR